MILLHTVFFLLVLAFSSTSIPAHALDVNKPVAAYRHDVFEARAGAPRGAIAMAQTADGWLWLGTPAGLFRFDGATFEAWRAPHGEQLLGQYITGLMAHPNGDLWIGYLYGGISVLRGGHLEHVQPVPGKPVGSTSSFTVDGDSVWLASSTGLFRYRDGQWTHFGPDHGLAVNRTRQVFADHYGRLWAADASNVYLFDRASSRFGRALHVAAEPIMTTSPDGRVWAADGDTVRLLPPPDAGWRAPPPSRVHSSAQQTLFDRDGNYWVGNCPAGVCVRRPAQSDDGVGALRDLSGAGVPNDGQVGKTGRVVTSLMEDREGALWMATTDGVERLRDTRMVPLVLAQPSGWPSMAFDAGGTLWIASTNMGSTGRLWKMEGGRPVEQHTGQASALVARGRDGAVLVAGERWIERRLGERLLARYPMPHGRDALVVRDMALLLAEDRDGIWLYYGGKGLLHLRDGVWQAPPSGAGLARAIYAFVDPRGRTWFGTRDNGVVMLDGEQRRSYGPADGIALGAVTFVDASRDVVISGDGGMAVWQDGRFRPLHAEGADLASVSGLVVSAEGDRWFTTRQGLFHVKAADWERSMRDPSEPLRGDTLDELDGFPGAGYGISPVPTLLQAPGGRMWVSGTDGVALFDRARPLIPAALLSTEVRGLVADGRRYPGDLPQVLAPRTERLRFDFTAPGATVPERVRFRYRLAGFDQGWIDAGALRSASYTNLGPGSYRFEVQALNANGVAGPVTAMPALRILPAFWQTSWFIGLCLLAAIAAAALAYRWKLGRVQRAWQVRMEERLGERERIARTLHDTFLQSLQGLLLQLDAVTTRLTPGSSERLRMETLLDRARRVAAEGRNQVQDLRETVPQADLASAIAAGIDALRTDRGVAVALEQIGAARPLESGMQQEIEAIAREAIANALRHAGARRLIVTLDWRGAAPALRVDDDGVGIAPALLAHGRPGHYGLRGMRERAARIGATLSVENRPGGGVALALTWPDLPQGEAPAPACAGSAK